jgi:hypothetical protein
LGSLHGAVFCFAFRGAAVEEPWPLHCLDCTYSGAAANFVREGILRSLPFFMSVSLFVLSLIINFLRFLFSSSFFAYLSSSFLFLSAFDYFILSFLL